MTEEKYIEFRGNRYRTTGSIRLADIMKLYFVQKALEGDETARELLDLSKIIISDYDGNQIYPPVKENK